MNGRPHPRVALNQYVFPLLGGFAQTTAVMDDPIEQLRKRIAELEADNAELRSPLEQLEREH